MSRWSSPLVAMEHSLRLENKCLSSLLDMNEAVHLTDTALAAFIANKFLNEQFAELAKKTREVAVMRRLAENEGQLSIVGRQGDQEQHDFTTVKLDKLLKEDASSVFLP